MILFFFFFPLSHRLVAPYVVICSVKRDMIIKSRCQIKIRKYMGQVFASDGFSFSLKYSLFTMFQVYHKVNQL